ncbi:MAG: OmpH family outer membrane protein [Proteobacteria bacterium]|nr:OmpH family outer membrane protein [Pseudomonadota bacterium]
MKLSRNASFVVVALIIVGASLFGFHTQVKSSDPAQALDGMTKIAVVDVEKLLKDSKAADSIEKQLIERREKLKEKVLAQEKNLRETEQSIVDQKAKLSKEDFEKKKKEFEKQLIEARQQLQKDKRGLEKSAGMAIDELRRNIVEIIAEMADKEKYDLVITRQNVVLAVKSMEITEPVMTELNKRVDKIDLKDAAVN